MKEAMIKSACLVTALTFLALAVASLACGLTLFSEQAPLYSSVAFFALTMFFTFGAFTIFTWSADNL